MKLLVSQLLAVLQQRELRRNLGAFGRYLALLSGFVVLYSGLFQAVMLWEGRRYSWLTGLYWTLTVMSTLGFGDITFHSDLGRAYTIAVLVTGIVLLLIVLPFSFIRNFYAPWLEAQLKLRAPRALPPETKGHVLVARHDPVSQALLPSLRAAGIECFVLEPDPVRALAHQGEDVPVIVGEPESVETWRAVRAENARLVVANLGDAPNTNLTLTVREHAGEVPIAAIVDDHDAIDILQMSGASHTLAVKHRLGEQLAGRVTAGAIRANVIGQFNGLVIAELPLRSTRLGGRTIRDTRLRELTGLSIVAYWERGRLHPAHPDTVLSENSVIVVVGTSDQVTQLDAMFVIYTPNENPVLVIGGGEVGRAVLRELRKREVKAHVIDQDPALRPVLESLADGVHIGDADNISVIQEAGIANAPSVVLTTHDDAVNIYLTVYCRKLNPRCHIISRITRDRNLEAVHRAGADFVLSQSGLAVKLIVSLLHNREMVLVGEAVDFFTVPVPAALAGRTLAESGIGARTGMNVIGIRNDGGPDVPPTAATVLEEGATLVLLGTTEQREELARLFKV